MRGPTVHVKVSQRGGLKNNGIDVSVHPWTVHIKEHDSITWVKDSGQVTDIRPRRSKKGVKWPFAKRRVMAGIRNAVVSLKRLPVKRTKTLHYTLDVTFTDHNGLQRKVSIDPDMVIES